MKSVALSGNKRAERGTTDAKEKRSEGKIPAVLYGGKENIHFTVNTVKFDKVINSPHVYFVDLDIEGTKVRAILKEVQYHPVNDSVLHADFLEVTEGKLLTVALPVQVEGKSPGVANGGKLRAVTRKLKVRGLAKDMPEAITADISTLKIGDSIKVGSLSYEGLTFLDSANTVVAAVKMSRVAISEEEEEEAEGAEGEATEGEATEGEAAAAE
ncbi:50S ribosomal protein L25/general stress protein Ctc [bacterium]|nr:50S ribosomal protein L25/general stress protein Ctc [bacterium]